MAPLPNTRLQYYARPFSYVSVDYLGPLDVVNARRTEKRRSVHKPCNEGSSFGSPSHSSDSCIMAIKSDNGTNFVGASNELKKEIAEINSKLADTLTNSLTSWNFNSPSAGVSERMVRSVKETMNAFVDGRKLNDEILNTALIDAKHLINARPLFYMPHTTSDVEALTPNHFLFW
uniref:Integrase catalytic domain-containing protein n=1 Tax=Anopheles christyi TaxID=43041 RepID=A0A182K4H3_9DIPT